MPKNYKYRTQGFNLESPGPATVEEYDQKAGGPGKCLEDAIDNEIYRGTIPAFWRKALPKVVELSGIALGVDEKATAKAKERAKTPEAAAKVSDVPEKFSSYISRVEATFGDDKEKHAELEALLKEIALSVEIDPSPSNREKGPGRDMLDAADSILGLPEEKREEKIGKMQAACTDATLERDEAGLPERESLARLVKAYVQYVTANL